MRNLFDPIGKSFKSLIHQDSTDYVCVIGGSNVDIMGSSPLIKSKESNVGRVSISPGGVARNIAESLGRLGIPTYFIGAVGNDHFGSIIIDSLKEVNVHLTGLRRIANISTGAYLAMLDDFRNMDCAINDMRITDHIDKEWVDICSEIISKASIVVLDCNLKSETIEAVMKVAKGKIFVDPVSMTKSVNIVPYLKELWGIKPNIYEAGVITNIKIESLDDAVMALRVMAQSNVKHPVITMDKGGVLAYDDGKIKHYLCKEVRPVNSSGAGDAFLATWVASEFLKLEFSESIKNAMVASIKTMLVIETVSRDLSRTNFEKWKQEVEIHETILEA